MPDDLKDKVVLITGASTGIGAAVARGFARVGSRIVIHYNASEAEAKAVAADVKRLGTEALLVQGDVMSSKDVERIVGKTMDDGIQGALRP